MSWADDPGRALGNRVPPVPSHPTIDDYERLANHYHTIRADPATEFGRLRELALEGCRLGTIRPADLVRRVRPAAVPVTMLMEPDPDLAGASVAVMRAIQRGDGAGPQYWARMIGEIERSRGSLSALVKGRREPEERRGGAVRARRRLALSDTAALGTQGQRWRAANVMLALAPALAARAFLASGATIRTNPTGGELSALSRRAELIVGMMANAPLCRELAEHAFGSLGDATLRMRLAANPYTPDSVLLRLLDEHGTEPEILNAVRLHEFAGGAVLRQSFLTLPDDPRAVGKALHDLVAARGDRPFLAMLDAGPGDVGWVRAMVRAAGSAVGDAARLAAYVRLAEMSAPEVVWAVELERAGSLEQMMPQVRESMMAGTGEALVRAGAGLGSGAGAGAGAKRTATGGRAGTVTPAVEMQRWRSDTALDEPIP
ncbi:hypothetical protein GCM10009839_17250 [Catenulispora yoronensis]|uniref:Uncharacterized protein n=1 Tax=Catenulispora yoronensis TaxID=450799 RepID=A0ABN2TTM2_9ACTN